MNAVFQPQQLTVTAIPPSMPVSTGTPIVRELVEREPYEGSYIVTPSAVEQVLSTKNLRMTDDVTIAPIPQNYGLITWNGSTLTVS